MKVLVLGATGRVGQSAVNFALEKGYTVKAYVRNKSKITDRPGLEIIEGEITQPGRLDEALRDCDAVINVVGGVVTQPSTVVTDSARALTEAMQRTGVRRYLGITGTAQMPKTFFGKIVATIIRRSPIGHAARDHDGAFELVSHSGLDWTLAGCPYIRDGKLTQRYKQKEWFPGGFKIISPQDVADFLVNEVERRDRLQQIVGIWY